MRSLPATLFIAIYLKRVHVLLTVSRELTMHCEIRITYVVYKLSFHSVS